MVLFDMLACCTGRDFNKRALEDNLQPHKKIETPVCATLNADSIKGASYEKPVSSPTLASKSQTTEDFVYMASLVVGSLAVVVSCLHGNEPSTGALALVLLAPIAMATRNPRPIDEHVKVGKTAQTCKTLDCIVDRKVDGIAELTSHFGMLAAKDSKYRLDAPTIRRFLKARKGDVNAAKGMLQNFAEWRAEAKPAQITPADLPNELPTRKGFAHGTDVDKQGIVWVFAARHDKGKRDLEEITKLVIYNMENAVAASEKAGLERVCVVFNLRGFGFKAMDYEVVKRLIRILAFYYPERLGRVLLWNAPYVFNMFWRVVSAWIDPVTTERISFCSGSLDEFIATEQLPVDATKAIG